MPLVKCTEVTLSAVIALLVLALQPAEYALQGNKQRIKKVIWGSPLLKFRSFNVVSYYTAITVASHDAGWSLSNNRRGRVGMPRVSPTSLFCGGALLTPKIVHTACHCLAYYKTVNMTYSIGKLKNPWENWLSVYVGWTVINEIEVSDGAWVKHSVIHELCGQVGFLDFALTYDFGLMVLATPVKLSKGHMKPAPIYTAREMAKHYVQVLSTQQVCLYVGFGVYDFVDKEKGTAGIQSPVLQHGWRVTSSWFECAITALEQFRHTNIPAFPYITWFCSHFFGKQRGSLMPGDSGGPVTCSEVRTAVVSFGSKYPEQNVSTEFLGALVYALEFNAAEYRKYLESNLRNFAKTNWDPTVEYTAVPPGFTYGTINPNLQIDFHQQSFSRGTPAAACILSYLFLTSLNFNYT